MRSRLASVLLCILMFSGLVVPLLILSNSDKTENLLPSNQMGLAETSFFWHDDCSNTTGWAENTTNVENLVQYYQSGISLLTDGNGLYSDTIPEYSSDLHGAQFFKKIRTPMKLENNLDFRVEIDHPGTSGMAGSVGVVLLDQYNASVFKAGGVDGWTGSACNAWVAYREDGSQATEYNNKSGAWSGVVRVWYDSETSSIKGDAAGVEFSLASSGSFDPSREVYWVGLVFYNMQSYPYESHIVTDITVSTTMDTLPPTIWHHDCSNTTGFVSQSSWDTSWYYAGWTIDSGLLSSSGTSISISNIPSGNGWHGPAFTYEFGTTFHVSDVLNFAVDIQIDNTVANYLGRYYLYLADTKQKPTYLFTGHDYLAASTTGAYGVQYFFENGTYFAYGSPSTYSYTDFDGRMETGLDEMNVYGYVDGFGQDNLAVLDESELSREIRYIVFMGGAFDADPLMPIRIHDIKLTFVESPEPEDELTIDHPADIVYNVGETGSNITWTPLSYYPYMYQLFVNNESIDSGLWSGNQIVVDVDGLGLGIYNYTLRVFNNMMESVSDDVIVTVLGQTVGGTLITMGISIGSITVIVVVTVLLLQRRPGEIVTTPSSYDW